MNWIEFIINSHTTPWITALLLGFVNAVSHCLLATNIAAICYISKDIENKKRIFLNGVFYTLGRTVTYTTLAILLTAILRRGTDIGFIQTFVSHYGDKLMGPLFLLIGIGLLFSHKINLPGLNFHLNKQIESKAQNGYKGSFLLGLILALFFCPTSAFIFFGILIPLATASDTGVLLPILFAIATGIPVIIATWVLAFSYQQINRFYDHIQLTGQWVKKIVSFLLILIGLYFLFFHHHHMH